MRKATLALLVLALVLAPGTVLADSLWKSSTDSPYSSKQSKTYQTNDLVTIIVDERSSASSGADTVTDKRTRWETVLNQWVQFSTSAGGGLAIGEGNPANQPEINLDARYRKNNAGTTGRDSSVQFKITGRIVEVLPNGNLVIEAKKKRTVNGETETLTVSGVIRQQDVNYDNVVKSERVDQLELIYMGEGTVGDTESRGFLSWILDVLWPF